MNTTGNITPTEKRMRLFNVNKSIKLSLEEFEELVTISTNIWTQYNCQRDSGKFTSAAWLSIENRARDKKDFDWQTSVRPSVQN